jgi:hypothetical protein
VSCTTLSAGRCTISKLSIARHLYATEQKKAPFFFLFILTGRPSGWLLPDGLNLKGRDAVSRLRFFRRSAYDGKTEGAEKELHFATCENGYGWMSMSLRFKNRESTLQEHREPKVESMEMGSKIENESQV